MAKIREILQKHRDIISYLFFGVLTTLVNYIVYFTLYNLIKLSGIISNIISWVAAVIFAFLTNKPFVFQSKDWSSATVLSELTKFVGCRVGSGLLETVIIFVTVDILSWNGNLIKILTGILVVIINYFSSKKIVFK